jgi:hypothetical protein
MHVSRVVVAGLALTVAATAITACSDRTTREPGRDPEAAAYAIQQLRSAGDYAWYPANLREVLPTTTVEAPDGTTTSVSSGLAIGRIVEVDDLRTFANSPDGPEEVDSSSPRAAWRTTRLRIAVEESVASPELGSEVRVALSFGLGADDALLRRGLLALGRVLVVLAPDGLPSEDDPKVLRVAMDGQLLGTVDKRGRIDFPGMDPSIKPTFLAEIDTLPELRAAAALPPLVIPVDAVGARTEGR